ncbi:MAG: WbqC family protein [Dehalococcoidales bacterium]|nr:WbqC family protein [Dehalococcoidales bacterium]
MIAAIHQPNYLPWMGYFYKIVNCDIFVFLDNVQYTKNGYINRNMIKTPQGAAWLTVGVLTKSRHGQLVSEVEINNSLPWSIIHQKSMFQSYSKAPYFKNYASFFQEIYARKWERLVDLNEALIKLICQILGINTVKFLFASELNVSGHSTELLVDICQAVDCDIYFSGPSGQDYMDEQFFVNQRITLRYSDFKHPAYNQLWGDFVPNMSIIDLLFNEGEKSLEILLGASS